MWLINFVTHCILTKKRILSAIRKTELKYRKILVDDQIFVQEIKKFLKTILNQSDKVV